MYTAAEALLRSDCSMVIYGNLNYRYNEEYKVWEIQTNNKHDLWKFSTMSSEEMTQVKFLPVMAEKSEL